MPAPKNTFKAALLNTDDLLVGLWVALASPHVAEVCAGAGFDWILIVGMVVIFYFFLIRPQSKRAKEHRELVSALAKAYSTAC